MCVCVCVCVCVYRLKGAKSCTMNRFHVSSLSKCLVETERSTGQMIKVIKQFKSIFSKILNISNLRK